MFSLILAIAGRLYSRRRYSIALDGFRTGSDGFGCYTWAGK